MSPLKGALLAAAAWVFVLVALCFVHTDVLMKGKLSAEEDERVSHRYGEVAGYGTVIAGVATFLMLKSTSRD
jgi:hypothetical protein